ncbi:MAG: alanine--tRNA ligase [Haloplasmataceae bacterium]|jgi:alanyl-tRNA synthetase|nr:alanine--tRNA ligase [Haloplasmataceae bacterium]
MKKLTGAQIRKMYLEFFKSKGHTIHPSQSLVPDDDPTLLWINSGVATLKKYFDGRLIPDNPRITNSQKSIRTNDIENVGKTARHHTFFEMLGNFSIGNYFKKEAIEFAWELLTSDKWYGFDKDRLYMTIYPSDEEAYRYWVKCGVEPSHIVKLEGNYWEIGEGPSGPNTEIFYDRGVTYEFNAPTEELYPGGENERYLEIWNLVFSQYNAIEGKPKSEYPELPNKNIDTGMGLERMTSVIQDVPTNYDTDLFMPIINKISEISKQNYLETKEKTIAFRVIADHIRTCVFAISDGALPSNEGRGYVIRRLIRRSVKYARKLGIERTFMKELVPVVADIMFDYYPEVKTKVDFIQTILEKEEIRFHETLQDGLNILNDVIKNTNSKEIDGKTAFKLYDTYGFPIELTIEYAEEAGLTVDVLEFKNELDAQRKRARDAREDMDSMQSQNKTLMDIKAESKFLGYKLLETEGKVLYIINKDELLTKAKKGDEVQIILDQTPFYALSGGQIADMGVMKNDHVTLAVNEVTKAPNKQHLHFCTVIEGTLNVGEKLNLIVEKQARAFITRNHTATHLLQKSLRIVLGDHIAQAGSYVSSDRLRFDFNHFEAIKKDQLTEIEKIVNEKIYESMSVHIEEMSITKAKEKGATALFNEKYGDIVRVVSASDFSIELCGGCHVTNTSEIGLFKIISESGIGAGIRRIEAVTSSKAVEYLQNYVQNVEAIANNLKANVHDVVDKVSILIDENKALQKELEAIRNKLANIEANELVNHVKMINGYNVLTATVKNIEINALRNMIDNFKDKLKSVIVVLANIEADKVMFMTGVSKDYVAKGVHAGMLVKEMASICGGNGGGRPDFAQAGAKNVEKVEIALNFLNDYLKNK